MNNTIPNQQDLELEALIQAETDLKRITELVRLRRPEFVALRHAEAIARIESGH